MDAEATRDISHRSVFYVFVVEKIQSVQDSCSPQSIALLPFVF